jgi:hypothetical protein
MRVTVCERVNFEVRRITAEPLIVAHMRVVCDNATHVLTYLNTVAAVRVTMAVSCTRATMSKPIPDKAEIALEYPDKFYIGTFEHASRFEAHLDPTGISLTLTRPGAEDVRKSVHMHLNFGLVAGILLELAESIGNLPRDDVMHRQQLADAVASLHAALVND